MKHYLWYFHSFLLWILMQIFSNEKIYLTFLLKKHKNVVQVFLPWSSWVPGESMDVIQEVCEPLEIT